jgi:hypothetical protein
MKVYGRSTCKDSLILDLNIGFSIFWGTTPFTVLKVESLRKSHITCQENVKRRILPLRGLELRPLCHLDRRGSVSDVRTSNLKSVMSSWTEFCELWTSLSRQEGSQRWWIKTDERERERERERSKSVNNDRHFAGVGLLFGLRFSQWWLPRILSSGT